MSRVLRSLVVVLVVSALAACAPAVETAPVDDEVACGTIGDAFRSFSQLIDEWAAPGADVSFEEADAAVASSTDSSLR